MSRLVDALSRPLPVPPEVLRQGPLREGAFPSPLHDTGLAARLGRWLGVLFVVCALTGAVSHWAQSPGAWIPFPTRPVGLYRVTQGLHVTAGVACVPVLLAKLYTVYPKLFTWPPARTLTHALERLSLLVLVGGALFQVATGIMNTAHWYAFGFFFTVGHYWGAWITLGALLVHVGSVLTTARTALAAPLEPASLDLGSADPAAAPEPPGRGLSRRALLGTTAVAGVAVVAVTAGQTVRPLAPLGLLAPRDPRIGPQGLPVNRTAAAAGVLAAATGGAYRLVVDGPRRLEFTLEDLAALDQVTADLPIACVEGWSAGATWTGVRVRDVLELAGVVGGREVRVESLQERGLFASSLLSPRAARDPLTLLALRLGGQPLHPDHGYPLRLIAPARPGVLQTKWVSRLVVVA